MDQKKNIFDIKIFNSLIKSTLSIKNIIIHYNWPRTTYNCNFYRNKKPYYSIWGKWHLSVWLFSNHLYKGKRKKKKKPIDTRFDTFFFFVIKTQTSYLVTYFKKNLIPCFIEFYSMKTFGGGGGRGGIWNLEEAEKLWLNIFFYK